MTRSIRSVFILTGSNANTRTSQRVKFDVVLLSPKTGQLFLERGRSSFTKLVSRVEHVVMVLACFGLEVSKVRI